MKLIIALFIITNTSFGQFLPLVIIGDDHRVRVTPELAESEIHHSIGQILINKGELGFFTCTATVISQIHILTAAHCILDPSGNEAVSVTFKPARGLDANIPITHRRISAKKFYYHPYYPISRRAKYDVAVIELTREVPVNALPIGRAPHMNRSRILKHPMLTWPLFLRIPSPEIMIAGYPGDKPNGQMWEGRGQLAYANFRNSNRYNVDTFAGQSGSAIRMNRRGEEVIIGVHSSGVSNLVNAHNLGAMFDDSILGMIEEWITTKSN